MDFLNIDENIDYELNKSLYFNQIYHNGINKKYYPNIQIPTSKISNCFTKSYGATQKSSGSVLFIKNSHEYNYGVEYLMAHHLNRIRYFSDLEISKLLCYNKDFKLFDNFGDFNKIKKNYLLLGNSINVKIVSLLIKKLLNF
jgi:hypothetical protein